MKHRIVTLLISALFFLACGYLLRVDFKERLETDVSSLLPSTNSEEARIARKLISSDHGKVVYLEVSGFSGDEAQVQLAEAQIVNFLGRHSLIASIDVVDEAAQLGLFKEISDHRMRLLFPKWLAEKHDAFVLEGGAPDAFAEWAAHEAVVDMDSFLESPLAMELTRPELMDPLLLGISRILALSEEESGPFAGESGPKEVGSCFFWIRLTDSPLSAATQTALKELFVELDTFLKAKGFSAKIEYGGLAKLAEASRERIQKDIIKINVLSGVGVLGVILMLMVRPWKFVFILPPLIGGGVGALVVSLLVFGRLNAIVLVVGSILIGTAIDYGIHLVFSDVSRRDFPSNKLVTYSCLSTVVGFSILLFSDLELVRQIGVFVGSGLLCAFMVARFFVGKNRWIGKGDLRELTLFDRHQWVFSSLTILVTLFGVLGLWNVDWHDDIRSWESADKEVVRSDIKLREKFGSKSEAQILLTTGDSYLDVLEKEQKLLVRLGGGVAHSHGFGLSQVLPTASDVEVVDDYREALPLFFDELEKSFEASGYDTTEFGDFFSEPVLAEVFGQRVLDYEASVARFVQTLSGPMSGMIGHTDGDRYWSLLAAPLSEEAAIVLAVERADTTLFSQLLFLNKVLDEHRVELLNFGLLAMLLITLCMLFVFGWVKGGLVVLLPVLGGSLAIGYCDIIFGSLNMFHLLGCFLGGAIALDYALFAVESFSRKEMVPQSVWLSAGTTIVSFMALGFSSIPVVQSLGVMVSLITCLTLLLIQGSKPLTAKILHR